ncbi:hypothetical protein GQ43DRAFT_441411 [Delitschia confertaspora ATCC 74209]|uniref:MFS general substrate transporter n=1 Tax=Delitschia confertaspora ATCC 74209 TaxID=1513339 RepID=A0A9P4JJP5_9PLEO|nr:hypothetical protein GQ43DRAFT_441411 [Delitschia confertaspora ATCC 74209]
MTPTDHPSSSSSSSSSSPLHSPPRNLSLPPDPHGSTVPHPKVVSFRRSSSPHLPSGEMNEQSPLLKPRTSHGDDSLKVMSPLNDDEDDWQGGRDQETKSVGYLILLTIAGLGLQIGWSVEMSYGSPYLLSLGLSKSLLALVWIAGPLSGTLVQPYVGMKSDNCRIRWGKRRPFIVGGAAATILSLMVLAWTREIVGGFLGIFGADRESQWVKNCIAFFAVVFVYVLDFAINVMQAALRCYVVDCVPTHQQESANAWMMRTTGVGNILGYISGYIDLPRYLPWLGQTQFKILCAIASFTMAATVATSCSTVQERDPTFDNPPKKQDGLVDFFKSLFHSVKKLPAQIRRVCHVQLFAWIGWFPFLFYITTYIGEIYVEPFFEANPHMTDAEIDKIWEDGTRMGTFALLVFALTTFAASVILPVIIKPTFKAPDTPPRTPMTPTTPHSMSGSGYFSARPTKTKPALQQRISSWLILLQVPGLTLRRAWFLSHLMFAGLMWMTFLVRGTTTATILVALVGIPWALTQWAPFALIGSEIAKRDAMKRGLLRPANHDVVDDLEDEEDQTGVILGIHNVAIAAPQAIASLVSSVIFRLLQKPRGTPGDYSVAWVLRLGGLCAIAAAIITRKVHEESDDVEVDSDRFTRRLD